MHTARQIIVSTLLQCYHYMDGTRCGLWLKTQPCQFTFRTSIVKCQSVAIGYNNYRWAMAHKQIICQDSPIVLGSC